MVIIEPHVIQLTPVINGVEFLKTIERAGRICYKSEDKITDDSAPKFVKMLIDRGHEAMIEHAPDISMLFVCDRGVSHEIVRHRLFSFAQESTRYCNYSQNKYGKEITVIKPLFWDEGSDQYTDWEAAMLYVESKYLRLIDGGATPQEARSVLPNSLKTEIIVTGNIRNWRHFFKLRTAKEAHPQMQEVANQALELLRRQIPIVFDDL